MRFVRVERPEVFGIHAANEGVGVEPRGAVEREDLAGIRVHRDHRAAPAGGEDLRDIALQIDVDRRVQRRPRHGREGRGDPALPHHVPQRAHFHESHAIGAAQGVVVLALESGFPDQRAEAQR